LQFLLEIVGGQIGEQSRNSDNWNGQRQELLSVGENQNSQKELDGRESFSGVVGQSPDSDNTELLESDATGTDADRCLKEVRRLIHKYITHLLGFQPKLYKFLGNL
jgi:hypothetical protein